jgi:hypothetical protein
MPSLSYEAQTLSLQSQFPNVYVAIIKIVAVKVWIKKLETTAVVPLFALQELSIYPHPCLRLLAAGCIAATDVVSE